MNTQKTVHPRRSLAIILTLFAILGGVYIVWQLENQPSTDDAYAYTDTINVTPEVNGKIILFSIRDNQYVQKGDILFLIDPRVYLETLNKAEASLKQLDQQIILAQRSVNAQRLGANAVSANVEKARASAKQMTESYRRLASLSNKGFVSLDVLDQARTAKQTADVALSAAVLDAESATAGISGVEALEAQRAVIQTDIALAKLNVEHTTVRAPFNGRIIGLTTTVGQYAAAGQPIFTLADTRQWFVVANFRETDLNNMRSGDAAIVYLMGNSKVAYPAVIDSIGYGVMPTDGSILSTGLPNVSRSINWVHVAQRFPVRIRITSTQTEAFRIGASAVAVVKPRVNIADETVPGPRQ